VNELTNLREQFIKATNEYKTSLEKLLSFYEADLKRAEDKLEVSKKLLAEGLIAKTQVQDYEYALAAAQAKVTETRRQMSGADEQIAGALLEADADAQIAKNLSLAKQRLVRTSSFIRFAGGSFQIRFARTCRSRCLARALFTIAGAWTIATPWIFLFIRTARKA
jgi:multidrug resistance efflux pump